MSRAVYIITAGRRELLQEQCKRVQKHNEGLTSPYAFTHDFKPGLNFLGQVVGTIKLWSPRD